MGQRIAAFDWSATPIGALPGWPANLRNTVSLMLRSAVPMVLLWGEDGIMIYNDAYAVFAGTRDPQLLGSRVREGWAEVADFNDHVMKVCLGGSTLSFQDQELTLDRHGAPAQAWMDLEYSPILDDQGKPEGVLAIVVETTQTHRAEERLRQGATQLTRAQEAGGVGLFSIDVQTNIITCTPEFCRIFGFPVCETVLATEIEKLILREDSGIVSNLDGRRKGTAALDVEYRIRHGETGAERLIARKGEYERDEGGAPVRLVGVVQDVTERRRIQLALEHSEASFGALAQHMPNQVWTARADGYLEWFNTRVYNYCGVPEGELDGEGWLRIVHPEDRETAVERWSAALARGATYQTEFRLRLASGGYRWHLGRAVPLHNAQGAITSWVGTNTDIHDQKLLEAETARERNRLWSMSQDLLLVCDYDGRITSISPSAERLLGWREDDMLGQNLISFVHPDDLERTAAEVSRVSQGATALSFENRYRTRAGDYRLFAWTAVPDGGRIHGVGRDITDERATEDALRQSQKMEAVGQLTGGIAHDFNNLLQAITGSLEIVERSIARGDTGNLAKWLGAAKTSASRAAALTHRLLAFSRRQPIDPRPVQAPRLLASMEDLLQRTLGERIDVALVLPDDSWLTRCDPNQLESAVLNLAINSRDAMPDGGTLTIEVRDVSIADAAFARQHDAAPGDYVRVSVTDTGTGMDKDVVERAFEPFFTTKPIGQGTGLGLSMIYGFARQAEGFALLESEAGRGTSVRLFLPRFTGEAHASEIVTASPATPAARARETVLVVEDEPIVAMLIVDVLTELGYRVIEASDGPEGLRVLRSEQAIDLVVTDIGLPGLDGREMIEQAAPLRPGLKVLFMTGYAENAGGAGGFLGPGMGLVTKPFDIESLAGKIRELLEEGG